MMTQQLTKNQAYNELHKKWKQWNNNHPDDAMPFTEWLDEMEGCEIGGWKLERDWTDNIVLVKV